MGDGGQVLHEWAFGDDDASRLIHGDSQDSVGASIAGRPTYDTSIADWGADGPGFGARTPTVIVSHSTPKDVPDGSVYTFVRTPAEAVSTAKALAGNMEVDVFSASTGGQLLWAGLIDELRLFSCPWSSARARDFSTT